jgi:hypothetical protein
MLQEIEDAADIGYAAKEIEWEEKSALHEQTIDSLNEKECVYRTVLTWDGKESRHRKPYDWHDLHYEAKRTRIRTYEHPLPSYKPVIKAALFELPCPEVYAAYRDAVWLILSTLCQQPVEILELNGVHLHRRLCDVIRRIDPSFCSSSVPWLFPDSANLSLLRVLISFAMLLEISTIPASECPA